jgi:hypothetical protein
MFKLEAAQISTDYEQSSMFNINLRVLSVHCATNWKVAGSRLNEVNDFVQFT